MRRTVGLLILCLAVPFTVAAQTAAEGRGYVSIFGGVQGADGGSQQSGTFSAYGESGRWDAEQSFDGGSTLWFGGGARVAGNFGIGAAYSRTTDKQVATVTVTAPHPLLFDTTRTGSLEENSLKHNVNAFHLQALYFFPVNEQFDVVVSAGPSFYTITHDFVTNAGFAEVGSPYTSINVTNVAITESDKTQTGFNLGAEAAYYFTKNVGIGGALRYLVATADMDVSSGVTSEVEISGMQFAIGAKIRF
jgi:opacity protein-like surface antigen